MNKKKRELEQNELADALGSKIEEIKPHIPKIAMFTGVAILAIIAVAFWLNVRKGVKEDQWREYFVSSRFSDSRGMKTVAEIFPDTTVGTLALINAADSDYANGSVNIVRNRENYNSQLKQAIENYELALQSKKVDKFARARATYALGYSYEAIGRFDDARKMYEEVVEQLPETPESELANKALSRVNDARLTAIYTAFKEWAPPAETAPDAGSMLPSRPDISMPSEVDPESGSSDVGSETPADDESSDEAESTEADNVDGDTGADSDEEDSDG